MDPLLFNPNCPRSCRGAGFHLFVFALCPQVPVSLGQPVGNLKLNTGLEPPVGGAGGAGDAGDAGVHWSDS